jgi:hypothetical protein
MEQDAMLHISQAIVSELYIDEEFECPRAQLTRLQRRFNVAQALKARSGALAVLVPRWKVACLSERASSQRDL